MTEYNKPDNVNHPSHYAGSCSLECFDVMTVCFGYGPVVHFCLCNAFKYLWRYKNKNGSEDLEKAKWYMDRANSIGFNSSHDEKLYVRLVDLYGKILNGKE